MYSTALFQYKSITLCALMYVMNNLNKLLTFYFPNVPYNNC